MTQRAADPHAGCFSRRCLVPVVMSLLWVMLLSPGRVSGAASRDVEAALDKARDYLFTKMNKDYYWEEIPKLDEKGGDHDVKGRQWGGPTAIATYALLASGINHQDPKLKPAVDWIKKQRIVGNYALGIRAQIWPFLPPINENKMGAIKDRDYLMKGMHGDPNLKKGQKAEQTGFYPYWFNDDPRAMRPGNNWWDLSVSQYGVLGMWACDQVDGVEVPVSYWADVDKAWKGAQVKDGPDMGGWPYRQGAASAEHAKVKATMTAAGIATLFITQDYLSAYQSYDRCKGGSNNKAIDDGLNWMDQHVKELLGGGQFYGMYGVERIGVASGKKYFGTIDWYSVGADYLMKAQAKDGSWGGSIPNTCFAMLFLSRGRAPVVMNKLEYSLNDPAYKAIKLPWAQRPRDVSNFTKYAQKNAEKFFNWQVVNLRVNADDLHDAPILYISGSLPLDFTEPEVKKLKEYCDAGGMILFNADCGDPAFVQSVLGRDGLARKIYPKYEFRELPQRHPIFTDEVYLAKNWKVQPKVLGLSNGVRELMLVVPEADLGRAWQTRAEKTKEEAFQLGVNIFYYAAEKGSFRFRGDSHIVNANPAIKPTMSVKIARVQAGDNPDPEPYGWKRLSAVLQNESKVGVALTDVPLGKGTLVPGATGFQMAHLTGTTKFKLSDAQRQELKKFVQGGGTLVVDAAGGSSDFAESAETELAAIFGGDPSAVGPVIPPDELPYTAPYKITQFGYRQFQRNRLTGKLNVPRVRGIDVAGKTRVFYSREDISAGLLGQPCDGIMGYDSATATAIMRNIVLFVAYNGKPPKPAPTTLPTTKPVGAPAAAAK